MLSRQIRELALRALTKRRLRAEMEIARQKLAEEAEREKELLARAEAVGQQLLIREQIQEDLSHLWTYRPPSKPVETGQSSLDDESWQDLAWFALGMNTPYVPSVKYRRPPRVGEARQEFDSLAEAQEYYEQYID